MTIERWPERAAAIYTIRHILHKIVGGLIMTRFIIFGILGILGSVLFTAIRSSIAERRYEFEGEASLILFPFYGMITIIYPLIAIHMGSIPWYGRGAIYTLTFYVAQYLLGLGLTRIGICPWKYPPGWSIGGLVRVSDAPVWFIAGLLIEWLYPYVKTMAAVLG